MEVLLVVGIMQVACFTLFYLSIMLLYFFERGWYSQEDPSENHEYFLYIDRWYRTISSFDFSNYKSAYIIHIGQSGILDRWEVKRSDSGVQF